MAHIGDPSRSPTAGGGDPRCGLQAMTPWPRKEALRMAVRDLPAGLLFEMIEGPDCFEKMIPGPDCFLKLFSGTCFLLKIVVGVIL